MNPRPTAPNVNWADHPGVWVDYLRDDRQWLIGEVERLRLALRQIFTGAADPHDGFTYDEIAQIADRALRASPLQEPVPVPAGECPRPIDGKRSARECVEAGQCGCDESAAGQDKK